MSSHFDRRGLARLDRVMEAHAQSGRVPGLAWVVARRGEAHRGQAGVLDLESGAPMRTDSLVRIASLTKPVTAVAALLLVEECRLRLEDPVDEWLPELAHPRVLEDPDGPLGNTVAADRPVTLRDLLTFRLGLGFDFLRGGLTHLLDAMAQLQVAPGPPAPAAAPAPDEWMRRLGSLPLAYQPGERWLYHTSAEVLGVLVARAAGQPLGTFLRERIFQPLGMDDTGFSVPAVARERFGPCYALDPGTGEREVYDPPDGQWAAPPAFPSGGGGLVSTVEDFLRFARMLHGWGTVSGLRILARPTVEAMVTNQLTATQLAVSGPDPEGATGWGLGVAVRLARTAPARSVGSYGWDGGLGTTWANDPREDLMGILFTNQAWTSSVMPSVFQDFWTATYTALAD